MRRCHRLVRAPAPVWNGELADTLEGAPDPHAVFTSEPIIAAAGAQTDRIEFLWGPVDVRPQSADKHRIKWC